MLTRRHINVHDDELCVMCETGDLETINHLFFDCTFARQCWSIILFHWDMSLGIEDRFLKAIREHVIPFFKEVALIAAWYVWKFRKTRYSTEALLVSTSVSQIFFLTVIPT
jgi:hypothetical protein